MDSLISYFRMIIIFLIFISFISILVPSKKYKTYLDFVLGLILISIVISPITKLLNLNKNNINSEILTKNSEQIIYNNDENYTVVLYENQIANQVATTIEKNFNVHPKEVKVEVNKKDISTLNKINLTLENNLIYIEPINISKSENENIVEKEHIKNIETLLSREYNLSVSNIYINIDN